MANHPDDYYIQQVLRGCAHAYEPLVERYKDKVFTLALKILKNREEAEETAQDVFVKCYQSLARFEGRAKFATWLYRITYNACMDALKRKQHYAVTEDIVSLQDAYGEHEESVLEQLLREDRNTFLTKAIEKLPADEQVILLMHYFEELSLKEIASIVHLSVTNVKVKLHRSRKKLYELLENNTLLRVL